MLNMYRINDIMVAIKAALEHTCMHDEEPIYSEICFEHIRDEIVHIMKHIRHIQMNISKSVPLSLSGEQGIKAYEILSDIMEELDDLHLELRNPSHQHTQHYMHHIDECRKEVHKLYKQMVDEFIETHKSFYELD